MVKRVSIIKEPGSWLPQALRKYTDPVTGVTVVSETAEKIANLVRRERVSKGVPVGDPVREVEEWVCMNLPSLCDRSADGVTLKTEFTSADVRAFVASVEDSIRHGVVDDAEADRRAGICHTCPYNKRLKGCVGCSGIAEMVYRVIGRRETKHSGSLRQCGVCGCALKAKVWVQPSGLKAASQIQNNAGEYPGWCWVPQALQ